MTIYFNLSLKCEASIVELSTLSSFFPKIFSHQITVWGSKSTFILENCQLSSNVCENIKTFIFRVLIHHGLEN